ncbi:hypothetical protein ACFX2J_008440 [Malus domestica]
MIPRNGLHGYDALIIFSHSVDRFGGSIDLASVLGFMYSGHDLIIESDTNASDLIRQITVDCDVDFNKDPAAMVIGHTSYAVSDTEGDHTVIASDDFIESDVILGNDKIEALVLFQRIGHAVNS